MNNVLATKVRTEFKKSSLNELRKDGYIPAVVYGRDEETTAIAVKKADLMKTINEVGRNGIIQLEVGGETRPVILGDYQTDEIRNDILHADFMYVTKSTEINTKVSVTMVGDAPGVKEGGVLQLSLHEVDITSKPQDIPEVIEIDVSELEINDTVTIGEIRDKYSKIDIRHEDDEAIVVLLPPAQTASEDEEEAAEAKEEATVES